MEQQQPTKEDIAMLAAGISSHDVKPEETPKPFDPAALTSQQPMDGRTGDPVVTEGLMSTERATIAKWITEDLTAGKMTPAEAAAARVEAGIEDPQSDTRTPEQRAHDAQFPAGKPEDFQFSYTPGATLTPEAKAFDKLSRQALSELGFSREVGTSLARAIKKSAMAHETMTDAQTWTQKAKVEAQLRAVWGKNFDTNLSMAQGLYKEIVAVHPELRRLEPSAALNDATIVNLIYLRALQRGR